MWQNIQELDPIVQALLATLFTWAVAALVVVTAIPVEPLLPYALSFAAGAMIFVVVEGVVPEWQRDGNADLATMRVLIGYTVMMILDVALG